MSGSIRYRSGYKYQLAEAYSLLIPIRPDAAIPPDVDPDDPPFVTLSPEGELCLKKGYAWDGPSGIPDTSRNMRASVVHDALYQLMWMDVLGQEWRRVAEREYRSILREDGVNPVRATLAYWAVRRSRSASLTIVGRRPEYTAPRGCVDE